MTIGAGELWAVIGPNGSGKSTFVRTALGLVPPPHLLDEPLHLHDGQDPLLRGSPQTLLEQANVEVTFVYVDHRIGDQLVGLHSQGSYRSPAARARTTSAPRTEAA